MNRIDDFDGLARAWLGEGPSTMADAAVQAALDEVHVTRQRRPWWPVWRLNPMENTSRLWIVAAAAILIGVVGVAVLTRGSSPHVGNPATPVPSPIPIPSGPLQPGTYLLPTDSFVPARVTVTVPEGWRNDGWALYRPDSVMALGFSTVYKTYLDPCHWQTSVNDIGPTVDDLVAGLRGESGRSVTAPVATTVAGYPAQRMDWSTPASLDATACDGGEYRTWVSPGPTVTGTGIDEPARYGYPSGSTGSIWVFDVDGVRLTMETVFPADQTAAQGAEMRAMIDSVRIDLPPAGAAVGPCLLQVTQVILGTDEASTRRIPLTAPYAASMATGADGTTDVTLWLQGSGWGPAVPGEVDIGTKAPGGDWSWHRPTSYFAGSQPVAIHLDRVGTWRVRAVGSNVGCLQDLPVEVGPAGA